MVDVVETIDDDLMIGVTAARRYVGVTSMQGRQQEVLMRFKGSMWLVKILVHLCNARLIKNESALLITILGVGVEPQKTDAAYRNRQP
jgi:hypothetical protein